MHISIPYDDRILEFAVGEDRQFIIELVPGCLSHGLISECRWGHAAMSFPSGCRSVFALGMVNVWKCLKDQTASYI